jgi:dienelactone hydrolase
MNYTEDKNTGAPYRAEYYKTLREMLSTRRAECDKVRYKHFLEMKDKPEEYRREFCEMLGWPLTEYDGKMPLAEEIAIFSDDERELSRLVFTLPIGVKFHGILMKHKDGARRPLAIVQHGGAGIADRLIGLFDGKTSNYNDIAERVFSRGINIFLPQLLLWSEEYYEPRIGDAGNIAERRAFDAELKQVGSSVTAVEIYGIMKSIDYLSTSAFVDPERIGMVGLSYGGFYTLFTAAIDTRIKAALASSQYNDRYLYPWSDWTWFSSAEKFLDNEVSALVYPRRLFLAVGDSDELFSADGARRTFMELRDMLPGDWVDFTVFSGAHEFIRDDGIMDKFAKSL